MYVYKSHIDQNMKTLFKNAYADELLFVSLAREFRTNLGTEYNIW